MASVYRNPVWPGYFADPFILKHGEQYYAFGTGITLEDVGGKPTAFKILQSRDLIRWQPLGAALPVRAEEAGHSFWAPEVAARNGRFFAYYSSAPAGRDELHRLRVAMAEAPEGPYQAVGFLLPENEGFCIDAHPFRDPRDGRCYLYFAKDFFDARVGTGLAVVELNDDMVTIRGESHPMLRANADWQIYQRNRPLYGRQWEAWHTVEGPCVVEHDGRYYCFYSGGNWQTHAYGVSYAVAEHPLGPWEHASADEPLVLQQVPNVVLGPGHNSYTVGPDGTEMLVYHAWDPAGTARRMCIDRLVWTKDGPRCAGPTTTAQSFSEDVAENRIR